MNTIDPTLNPLEVILVCEHYEKRGVKHYTLARGNDCIWAWHGRINEYFIFRDGKLVDIQID
jgi:mannose-6-phosphate isomerase-like protein (cupin superfamily)